MSLLRTATRGPGTGAAPTPLLVSLLVALLGGCVDTDLGDELNWTGPFPRADEGFGPIDDGAKPAPGETGGDPWGDDAGDPGSVFVGDPSEPDETPPWLVAATSCAFAELPMGAVCVSSGPAGIALRLWASEPVLARVRADAIGMDEATEELFTEHHLVLAPLPPSTEVAAVVGIEDRAGLTAEAGPFIVSTTPSAPSIVINEVLLDPLGTEPNQEFVELHNYGDTEVSVDGWVLADEGGEDKLTFPTPLPPGSYAVIVSNRYEPGAGGDPPPGPGALVIVLEGPIGSSGLRNDGEQISLRDSFGELVSTYPSLGEPPPAGSSVERLSPQAPDGDPGNWVPNPWATATPGGPNDSTDG